MICLISSLSAAKADRAEYPITADPINAIYVGFIGVVTI
jgi:hypothetical protein